MPDGSLITSISTHLKVMQDTAWIRAASYGKVNRVSRTLWNQDDSCAPGWAHITITPTRFLSQNTKQLRHVKGNDFHFSAILQLLDSVVAGVTYPLKHLTNNYCPFSFFSYIFDRSLSFCISPITKQQIDNPIQKGGRNPNNILKSTPILKEKCPKKTSYSVQKMPRHSFWARIVIIRMIKYQRIITLELCSI